MIGPGPAWKNVGMTRRDLLAGYAALAAASLLDTAPSRGQAPDMASPSQDTAPQGTALLWRRNAVDPAAAIAARRPSSREATVSCMERLGAVDPKVNAAVEVVADETLAAGHPAEQLRRAP